MTPSRLHVKRSTPRQMLKAKKEEEEKKKEKENLEIKRKTT